MSLLRNSTMMQADQARSGAIFKEVEAGIMAAAREKQSIGGALSRARKALHAHDREVHIETTLEFEAIDGQIFDHDWHVLVLHPDGRYVAIIREP